MNTEMWVHDHWVERKPSTGRRPNPEKLRILKRIRDELDIDFGTGYRCRVSLRDLRKIDQLLERNLPHADKHTGV